MISGYLKCEGRLRGCPVSTHATGQSFLVVKLLERRGIWEKGELLTIEKRELRESGSGRKDMFDDLPFGKRSPTPKYVYDYE